VLLNSLVLAWVEHPDGYALLRKYAFDKGVSMDSVMRKVGAGETALEGHNVELSCSIDSSASPVPTPC